MMTDFTNNNRIPLPQTEMSEAEFIAKSFHDIYEALAPEFGYATRRLSQVAWQDVPAQNKKLMIATVQELFNHGLIKRGANFDLHEYNQRGDYNDKILETKQELSQRLSETDSQVEGGKNAPESEDTPLKDTP